MSLEMAEISDILDHRLDFIPEADFEAFLRLAPAKWVVYLMTDGDGRSIQLLCVKNLRYSLKHRLGGDETIGLSKRVNYREIVRAIHWRRVDSALEADWIYYEVARRIFPTTYQGMVGFRPAWFIHINPEASFPRYTKTIDLTNKTGIFIGPLEDKHVAGKLIESVEDWFDLCRYYHILTEAPNGRACAYKEMGKCPAPCDGSFSLPQYRRMIETSAKVLVDPREFIREQTRRMEDAAMELRFEIAAKIKNYITQLSQLGKGPLRHVRRLSDFNFVSLQRGPRDGSAKIFLITPGEIQEIADLIAAPSRPSEILRLILATADEHRAHPIDTPGVERIGIVTHHLFTSRQTHGVFLPLADITEKQILKAYQDLLKQKQKDDPEGEGVVKELQEMS
jgi:excinuclease UvrABC nuclease subunit